MRILGIGDYCDLGDMYLRLSECGHEVRVHIADPAYQQVFTGMLNKCVDWRQELPWIRSAGKDGVIVFETAHMGLVQDELRRNGFNVIGGCAYGDRLENDRVFGQTVMHHIGLKTAPVHAFHDFEAAISFITQHPRRYVYKHNGHHLPSTHNYVGVLDHGGDLIELLKSYQRWWPAQTRPDFILMDHISGIETGIGAYFDGLSFLLPACLDWEHKRFFPGDLGELTGEMGTLVTYRGSERLFQQTLAPMAPLLAEAGYQGYINLNTIINADGVWPLEFTCRFGYPGYSILSALQEPDWAQLFNAILSHPHGRFITKPGFAVGVVLTVPPFPYLPEFERLSKGMPVLFSQVLTHSERSHIHYGEVELIDGILATSGASGFVLVVTGTGVDVTKAQTAVNGLIRKVVVPNARYRNDIGDRFRLRDEDALRRLGYLS